ncbi:MAG: hypothetical protein LBP65_01260 [Puniceicoccales bacterium]|jgi:hypothetical protein|nr:hypothetical protein [Puniceicoccales bacterium]
MNNQQPQQRRSPPIKPVDPAIYSFNIGLVKITTNRGQPRRAGLPSTTEIRPSVGRMEQRLDAIVDMTSFESILLDALRPDVKDRAMLVPVNFHSRLNSLRKSLRRGLAKKNEKEEAELEALLTELESQLAEETGRNELLEQYRLTILIG